MLTVLGYQNGLGALYRQGRHYSILTPEITKNYANLGGSMLGTSRVPQFMSSNPAEKEEALNRAVDSLVGDDVDILYIIGGDGSMRAAHSLWKIANNRGKEISVIAVPKTMDNDILWVWQSFGFLSAVERAKEVIRQLQTEAKSNPRLCIIQLFGSDSGFVVTHAVLASGACDLFLIPEVQFCIEKISDLITNILRKRYQQNPSLENTYAMIVMAETAIPQDADKYLEDKDIGLTKDEKKEIEQYLKNQRVFGQTHDDLRSGGLKLLSKVLQQKINNMPGEYWDNFRVFSNEPRHLIRAISPSSSDIIFGERLGALVVDCAMAGYTDFMISQWLTEYVMVPLELVVLGRKRIPRDGIFLKSVIATTGQPDELC